MTEFFDDDLRPRETDSDTLKKIYAEINDCVRMNERSRKALRARIDRICLAGLLHRKGPDGWDDDAEALYTRFSIPPASERRDGHPGAYWRPWVRLHLAPLPKFFDDSSHPSLIAAIGNACWSFESLSRINANAIASPSEGILHEKLGEGSVTRFSFVPHAWKSQESYIFDTSASPPKTTRVPPPDLYPPPVGKAPIGTEEEGTEAGRLAGKTAGTEAAKRNVTIQLPLAPMRSADGRPYSDVYRRGFTRGARSNAQRFWETTRGEIEGLEDARRRATEDVRLGKPPLPKDDIQPETLGDRHDKPQPYKTAYLRVATSEYISIYAKLKAREEELLRKAQLDAEARAQKAEADAKRQAAKVEADAKRRVAEAEDRARKEAEARRKEQAEAKRRAAEAKKVDEARRKEQAEAKRRLAEAEERTRKEAEARRKEAEARRKEQAEAKRLAEQDAKRKADAEAAAARERDEQHKRKIRVEIITAFISAGIPRNYSEMAFATLQKGIPHVRIVY